MRLSQREDTCEERIQREIMEIMESAVRVPCLQGEKELLPDLPGS